MTVNSSLNKIQYVGTGGVTLFAFPYPFELLTDIVTTVVDTSVTPNLDITSSFTFTVAGGSGDVGTVNIVPAPSTVTATNRITIKRVVSATQITSYPESGPFPAKSHEKALDKLTELCQQIIETQARAITLSANTAVATTPSLADPVAGSLIGWDASGTSIVNYLAASTSLTPVSSYMATVLVASTSAAARSTLGLANAVIGQAPVTTNIGNAYSVTLSPAPASLYAGLVATCIINTTNTGASTLNVNGLTAKNITQPASVGPSSLVSGELTTNQLATFVYDGAQFVLLSPQATLIKSVKTQKFTSSGTYTPSSGMLYCQVECVGGGGGGGGVAASLANNAVAAGGGGGGYARKLLTAATVGGSQTVTIGAGGAGGVAGNNAGSSGGSTSLGSLCVAAAGGGGQGSANAATVVNFPGAGGQGTTGDYLGAGSPGGTGIGISGNVCSGFGGASVFGGGGFITQNSAGQAGFANTGGGGGGASSLTNTAFAGGAGAAGVVIVTEFCTL
jgi:hypothetical protein